MRTDIIKAKQLLEKDDFFSKSKGISLLKHIYDADAIVVLKTYIVGFSDSNLIELCQEAIDHLEQNLIAREQVKNEVRKSLIGIPVNETSPQWFEFCEKIAPIIADLDAEKNPFVKATIVKQVGNFKNEYAIPSLVKYLNDSDPRVVANTIEGLDAIGGERILQFIVPLLGDNNARVRANASKAVWKFSPSKVYLVLGEMLTSKDVNIQKGAIFSINNIKTDESIELLVSALDKLNGYEKNYARQVIKTYQRDKLKQKIKSPAVMYGTGGVLLGILLIFFAFHQFSWDLVKKAEDKDLRVYKNKEVFVTTSSGESVKIKVPSHLTFAKNLPSGVIQSQTRIYNSYVSKILSKYVNNFDDKKDDPYHASKNKNLRYAEGLMQFGKYNESEIYYKQILSENLDKPYIALEAITGLYNIYSVTNRKDKLKELTELLEKCRKIKLCITIGKANTLGKQLDALSGMKKMVKIMYLIKKYPEAKVISKLVKSGLNIKNAKESYNKLKSILNK